MKLSKLSVLFVILFSLLVIPNVHAVLFTLNDTNSANLGDAQIDSYSANTNYGTATTMMVRSGNNGTSVSGNRRILMLWDLSVIPSDVVITNANLTVYLHAQTSGSGRQLVAYNSSNSWAEATITWNLAPAPDTLQDNITQSSTLATWIYWNVTNAVLYQYSQADKTLSIVVKDDVEGSSATKDNSFRSQEYGSNEPMLVITVTDTTAPTFSSNSNNATGVRLPVKHSLLWADNIQLNGYIFSFDNCTGSFVNDTWVAFGSTGWSNVTKTISSTVGCTIQWKFYANDTSNNMAVSSTYNYVTTNNAPTLTSAIEPTDPSTYPASPLNFNVTACDAEGTVDLETIQFEFNTTGATLGNTTITDYIAVNSSCRTYGVTKDPIAGTYSWKWYATDRSSYQATPQSGTFTLSKGTLAGSITCTPSSTVTYPTQTSCSYSESNTGDGDVSYVFTKDDASKSSPDVNTYGVGSYTYKLNTTSATFANWSSSSSITTQVLTVNKGTLAGSININPASPQTYPKTTVATPSETNQGDADVVYQFYRDTTLYSQNTGSAPSAETIKLGVGSYTYKLNTTGATFTNWTSSSSITTSGLTISQNSTAGLLNFYINGTQANYAFNVSTVGNFTVAWIGEDSRTVYLDSNYTGWTQQSGTNTIYNLTTLNTLGTNWNFTASKPSDTNYSAYAVTYYVNVSPTNVAPTISNLKDPADTSYVKGASYQFNATVCDDDAVTQIDTVIFEFDSANVTVATYAGINTTCREYYTTKTDLPAKAYTPKWYANDTNGAVATPQSGAFEITRANPATTLDLSPAGTFTYETQETATCSGNNSDTGVTTKLWRNGVDVNTTENGIAIYLPANTHNYICNSTQTENFTSATVSDSIIINQKNANVQVFPATQSLQYENSVQQYCLDDAVLLNCGLYLEDVSAINGSTIIYGVGVHNFKANITDTSNYTNYQSTSALTITVKSITIYLSLNGTQGNKTYTYPQVINATTWKDSTLNNEGTVELLRDGVSKGSGASVAEIILLGANVNGYNYSATFSATNYSATAITSNRFAIVNLGSQTISLVITPSTTVIYPTETTATCSRTAGDSGSTLSLYRDGVEKASGTSSPQTEVITLGANSYGYICNLTATSNYSSATTSDTLIVNQQPSSITLYLNGSTSDRSYSLGQSINITAVVNVSGKTIYLDLNATGFGNNFASGTTTVTNITTADALGIGLWNVTGHYNGDTNTSASSKTLLLTVGDTTDPTYSNLVASPTSPATYAPNQNYQFNGTFNDNIAISTVILEWNGTSNTTVTTNVSDVYYTTKTDLLVGSYTYKYYFNDTSGNMVVTTQQNYVVDKNSTTLYLAFNGTQANAYFQFNNSNHPSVINITAWKTISGETLTLLKNGTSTGTASGNSITELNGTMPASVYNFTITMTSNNYTFTPVTRWLYVRDEDDYVLETQNYQNLSWNSTADFTLDWVGTTSNVTMNITIVKNNTDSNINYTDVLTDFSSSSYYFTYWLNESTLQVYNDTIFNEPYTILVQFWKRKSHVTSYSLTKEILSGQDKFTLDFTINMTINETRNQTLKIPIPISVLTDWISLTSSDQTIGLKSVGGSETGITLSEDSTYVYFTIGITHSSSSLEYSGSTYDGRLIYYISTSGGGGGTPPPSGGGGGGGGCIKEGGYCVSETDCCRNLACNVIEGKKFKKCMPLPNVTAYGNFTVSFVLYPMDITPDPYVSTLPLSHIILPIISAQNTGNQTTDFSSYFTCPMIKNLTSGIFEAVEYCAQHDDGRSWCYITGAEASNQTIDFRIPPNGIKMFKIECDIPLNVTMDSFYETSFCVKSTATNEEKCAMVSIPIKQPSASALSLAYIGQGLFNMFDYGLFCFAGEKDYSNCLKSFPTTRFGIGQFSIGRIPLFWIFIGVSFGLMFWKRPFIVLFIILLVIEFLRWIGGV